MSIISDDDRPPLSPHSSPSTYSTSSSTSSHSSSSVEDGDDDPNSPLQPPNPPFSHTFAPPFYGRPPTPLPPSPSLTSLLRPSRPTTPDASDDDGSGLHHNGGGGGGDPIPRAAPKVPTYEYYGFVLYLFSTLSFGVYLLWSYLPSPFLHGLGIYYYPNRWWSLAVPSFLVMLLCYIYIALAAYNVERLTLPLSDLGTVVDEAGIVATVDSKGRIRGGLEGRRREKERRERGGGGGGKKDGGRSGRGHKREKSEGDVGYKEKMGPDGRLDWREVWNEGTDAVMDVPLAGVCEVLYGEGRASDDEGCTC
ncbi:PIG-P domain-containing protein [Coniochaeta sp. 2T2.1]|nr:PIG-P domain-containing protein [Coniochaeta sp. 2T2.1]